MFFQVVDWLDEFLNEFVWLMLMVDVLIGVLCSGGVDLFVIMVVVVRYYFDLKIFYVNIVGKLSEYFVVQELLDYFKLELKKVDV